MSKCKKIMSILLLFLALFTSGLANIVASEDAGYVYDGIHVDVQINEQREYRIVETMDIDFYESMHGIVRTIPKSGSVESYEIKDVAVEGMPYSTKDTTSSTEVTIGDKQRLIKGKQRVVLSYTLAHYQDYDTTQDVAYLNLLGTDYDCEVKQFSADVTFPKEGALQAYTLTSGLYKSAENEYVSGAVNGNTLHVQSLKALPAKHGISLQLNFEEGFFEQAPQYPFPYIIEKHDVDIMIDKEQDFMVEQRLVVRTQKEYARVELPIISASWKDGDYRIYEVESEDKNLLFTGGKRLVTTINHIGTTVLNVKYRVHPYALFSDMDLSLFSSDEITQMESLSMTLHLPYTYKDTGIQVTSGRVGDTNQEQRYQLSINDATITLSTKATISTGENFILHVPLKQGKFQRSIANVTWIACIVAGLFALLILILRCLVFRKKELTIPVNFYPPRGINPAEAGYIIDMDLSNSDLTSLLYYWADKGWLKINITDSLYWFEMQKEPDGTASYYEKTLFHAMFSYGSDHKVTKNELMNKFYKDIREAKKVIKRKYQGEQCLYQPTIEILRRVAMFASVLPVMMMSFIVQYEVYGDMLLALLSCFLYLPSILILYGVVKIGQKVHAKCIPFYNVVIISIFYAILILFHMMSEVFIFKGDPTPMLISFAITHLCFALSMGIHRNSGYRNRLLSSLLGFREFILLAQKDELETLLEKDPEYYYHVLPYAQVLHVSDIWENKFKDLQMEAPSWYTSTTLFNYAIFLQSLHSLNREMRRAVSAPSNSGSRGSGGFTGNGGGFSGGGFSGGGSGGGGSHGW